MGPGSAAHHAARAARCAASGTRTCFTPAIDRAGRATRPGDTALRAAAGRAGPPRTARHEGRGQAARPDPAGGKEDRREPDDPRGSRGQPRRCGLIFGGGGIIAAVSRTRCSARALLRRAGTHSSLGKVDPGSAASRRKSGALRSIRGKDRAARRADGNVTAPIIGLQLKTVIAKFSPASAPIAAFPFRRYVYVRSIAYVGAIITEKARIISGRTGSSVCSSFQHCLRQRKR